MKKIISFLIIFSLFAVIPSFSLASASGNNEEALSLLKNIGIVSSDFVMSDDAITRAEFSYMVSKMVDLTERPTIDTVFYDVKSDNIYSGYIKKYLQKVKKY